MKFFTCMLLGLALALALAGCSPKKRDAGAQTPLRVAAASDLKFALDELVAELRAKDSAFVVDVTYGSSGNLKTQIEQGAPFDMLLSADLRFPQALVKSGKAASADLFPYAVGRLVIWIKKDSPLDLANLQHKALLDPAIRKVAIANPDHAPYGQAAVAALRHFDIHDAVAPKFVLGENIAQTAQFVESGAAHAGIIALSLAVAPAMRDKGRFWEIPLNAFPRLLQGGVIVGATKKRERAEQLRAALTSRHGQEVLRRFGFIMPDEKRDAAH